jgi:hypothetical protein
VACGCVTELRKRLVKHNQQDVDPLIGEGLRHAKQGAMSDLDGSNFQIAQFLRYVPPSLPR